MQPLLVDSGNALFSPKTAKKVTIEAEVNARGIAEIYNLMNYHGVSIGPYDLAAGLDFLKGLEQHGYPVISANLYENGTLVFKPFKSVDIGSLKIALVGLTSVADTEMYKVANPVQVLDNLLPELQVSHDLIILLFNGPDRSARALAAKYQTINVIIGADPRKGNLQPLIINGSLLTQVDTRGKYLGALFVEWLGATWKEDFTTELEELENLLKQEKWKLERLEAAADQTSARQQRQKASVTNTISMLQQKIERIQGKQDRFFTDLPASSYRSEFFALKPSTPIDRRIEAQVGKLKQETDRARMSSAQP